MQADTYRPFSKKKIRIRNRETAIYLNNFLFKNEKNNKETEEQIEELIREVIRDKFEECYIGFVCNLNL